jgi:UDP-glucuronate 4-epimerase
MQGGDVRATQADTEALASWIDYRPDTPVKVDIARFSRW